MGRHACPRRVNVQGTAGLVNPVPVPETVTRRPAPVSQCGWVVARCWRESEQARPQGQLRAFLIPLQERLVRIGRRCLPEGSQYAPLLISTLRPVIFAK